MNFFKGIAFLGQLLRLKFTGDAIPLSIIFNVTNHCNCRCRHCYAAYFDRNHDNEMTTSQAKDLLEDLRANGCLRVSFSGGEPLLRNDIEDLIDTALSLGMSVTLNSNGILVPRRLKALKKVHTLAVSLDGRPEHHDYIRGAGTAEKALKAIEQATKAGIRVHVNMVLNRYNLNDIDYILDMARRYHIKAEFALTISKIGEENDRGDTIKAESDQYRRAIRYIIQKKKAGAPVLFSAAAYESVFNCWPDFSVEEIRGAPPPAKMPQCPAGKFFGLIDADGTLWACPHLIGKTEAKNALTCGVAQAWKTAMQHNCTGCYQVYHHEFSLLMNLDSRVVWNYAVNVLGLK